NINFNKMAPKKHNAPVRCNIPTDKPDIPLDQPVPIDAFDMDEKFKDEIPDLFVSVSKRLLKDQDTFARHKYHVGRTDYIYHDIELIPGAKPYHISERKSSPLDKQIKANWIHYMVKHGLARECKSPWA